MRPCEHETPKPDDCHLCWLYVNEPAYRRLWGGPVAPADVEALVAPLGRPWNAAPAPAQVTVAIPHLNTPEMLQVALSLWRLQTIRPYFVVVDTGSPWRVVEELESWRGDDLEIHYLRGGGYSHSSDGVSVAMDVCFGRCRTPHLFSTHTDVFPRRRDFLEWLVGQCSESCPVVGWEMSPRPGTDKWRGVVSHTATVWHAPSMRRIGLQWSLERYYAVAGRPGGTTVGWPDTESGPDECLRRAGITPKLLGPEPNFRLHRTEWFDHARSAAGVIVHAAPGSPLRQRVEAYGAQALAEARARVGEWSARGTGRRSLPCLHLGSAARGPDTVRAWHQCDKGKGVVCPCRECQDCSEYEADG